MLREALVGGDDASLAEMLRVPEYWNKTRTYIRGGKEVTQPLAVAFCAEQLGRSEFNTRYVRGLCRKLMAEGLHSVEVYRAGDAAEKNQGCTKYEDKIVRVEDVYRGHRARYWPEANPDAFSIPFHAGCHHSIRRVRR